MSDLSKLYQTQISLSEWFQAIGHKDTEKFRQEDNEKRETLKILHQIINLPFDQPYQFTAQAVADRSAEFQTFLSEHGTELCALRLIPLEPTLPKLRTRGASINDSLAWFASQQIDPVKYRADFVPHPSDHLWSTIFIIHQEGIFGEIIAGSHNQLTQGFYTDGEPISFSYDFSEWKLSTNNAQAAEYLKQLIQYLHVSPEQEASIKEKTPATFSHGFLCGYFESVASSQYGTWFIDYNRTLAEMYTQYQPPIIATEKGADLKGQCGSPGKAQGKVRIVKTITDIFEAGEVLVCEMTTPEYLPLMQRAAAIVTDQGGILSHAAIVARELKKPCIVATREATQKLQTGQEVEVNAAAGVVKILA